LTQPSHPIHLTITKSSQITFAGIAGLENAGASIFAMSLSLDQLTERVRVELSLSSEQGESALSIPDLYFFSPIAWMEIRRNSAWST
jgi:hypothetical protein